MFDWARQFWNEGIPNIVVHQRRRIIVLIALSAICIGVSTYGYCLYTLSYYYLSGHFNADPGLRMKEEGRIEVKGVVDGAEWQVSLDENVRMCDLIAFKNGRLALNARLVVESRTSPNRIFLFLNGTRIEIGKGRSGNHAVTAVPFTSEERVSAKEALRAVRGLIDKTNAEFVSRQKLLERRLFGEDIDYIEYVLDQSTISW